MAYWIIISDSCEARIYSADQINLLSPFLQLIEKLSHGESKLKKHELISDRPGHYQTRTTARGAYSQKTDLKEIEKEKFAQELAYELEKGRKNNKYNHLIMAMPAKFYGLLERHLSKNTIKLIEHMIPKDYLILTEKELEENLRIYCKPQFI